MATVAWLGTAVSIPQEGSFTLGGTWAQNDTITLTINNKSLTLTVGSTTDIPTILDNLVVMLSGSGSLGTGYSVTQYGSKVGEFAKLTFTEDGSTDLQVTGPSDGQPFTITKTISSTSGTMTTYSADVTPTGPHHWDDADNWSGGSVPSDGDTVVFDGRAAASLKYALSQATTTPAKIIVTDGFGPNLEIGLPEVNADSSSYKHDEYLPTYLSLGDAADAQKITVEISASLCGRIKLDTNDAETELTMDAMGSRSDSAIPAMLWKGTHASNIVNVNKGDLGIAYMDGESATVATLNVGYITSQAGDAQVACGDGATITTIIKSGGILETNSGFTTMTHTGGEWTHKAGNITTADLLSGTMYYAASGTITTLAVYGGAMADFTRGTQSRTVTNCTLTKGAGWKDPRGTVTVTNGWDFYGCTVDDLSVFEIKPHQTLTPSAI